jgi:hypothetical protein
LQTVPGHGYLQKLGLHRRLAETRAPSVALGIDAVLERTVEDFDELDSEFQSSEGCIVDLFVVYSPTYRVPAMHLAAHDSCKPSFLMTDPDRGLLIHFTAD